MQPCYSWEGEDVLANKIFKDHLGVDQGFYLDIGAHHPFNLSNTTLLYERGWRGINVDAMPGAMDEFIEARPDDINLEAGVSDKPGALLYSIFKDPGLNGFLTTDQINHHIGRGEALLDQKVIETTTINDIIEKHAKGRHIDLLTIDVEGLDYTILKSLDDKHRPTMIITETLGFSDIPSIIGSPIYELMLSRDYAFFSRLHFSCFFVDKRYRRP